MNVGEVENPGTFDSEKKKASTAPENGDGKSLESSRIRDLDEPIGDDGVNYDVYADEETTNTTATTEAEINFSADDIRKRKKTEYFVNIRGAEKIKREEEKRQAAHEKEVLNAARREEKETKRAEKAAAEKRAREEKYRGAEEKNIHKEFIAEEKHARKVERAEKHAHELAAYKERRHKRLEKIKNLTWTGKRKIIPITIFILAISTTLGYVFILKPQLEQQRIAEQERIRKEMLANIDTEASSLAVKILNEAENAKGAGLSQQQCDRLFIDAIEAAENDAQLVMLTIQYADYNYRIYRDIDSALEILNTVAGKYSTKMQAERFGGIAIYFYKEKGDEEAIERYEHLLYTIKTGEFKENLKERLEINNE
ncbi:MAG: hypothetical protein MJ154_00675 [Candidatus Saccharibacteria bacterium]|nr:hypothetical protein [Candidatus Saccharibacteria bacterium]